MRIFETIVLRQLGDEAVVAPSRRIPGGIIDMKRQGFVTASHDDLLILMSSDRKYSDLQFEHYALFFQSSSIKFRS
jgi:hypothetical protein